MAKLDINLSKELFESHDKDEKYVVWVRDLNYKQPTNSSKPVEKDLERPCTRGYPALHSPHHPVELSLKQLQCLYYILQGFSAKQIAHQLKRSIRTIDTHIDILKAKLNCRTKVEFGVKVDLAQIMALLKAKQSANQVKKSKKPSVKEMLS